MRYIRFYGSAGFCGTNEEVYDLFLDEMTDEELDDIAEQKRRELGESYEYLATLGYYEEDCATIEDFEEALELAVESYWDDVWIAWEEVTEEEYKENAWEA